MLFALPTPAPGKDRFAAPTVECDPVPGLGAFSQDGRIGAFGTAFLSVRIDTAVRTAFHGWLAARRPAVFLAGRRGFLGTAPLSLFKSTVRAASGWLTGRAADEVFQDGRTGALGTARPSVHADTAVRTAFHGWLAVRRPVVFLAGRKGLLGTAPLSLLKPAVRAASGWLPGRTVDAAFQDGRTGAPGTARPSVPTDTAVRTAFHGWLAVRRPVAFMTAGAAGDDSPAPAADYHVSVLPAEVSDWMAAGEGKYIIDGTLGGGGHSEAFLKAGARVLGIDRDPEALAYASRRLARFGDRFRTWQGNFADLRDNPEVRGEQQADGLLLDLGVSSRQLDAAGRGFSFRGEGPLDMRMGPSCAFDAAHVVSEWPESELVRVFREYGEEPQARRIAAAIVARRAARPFATTTDLADCIEKTIGRHGRIHPATKAFQAIRMVVNDELGSLERALDASLQVLRPGGRLLVITFHSLEDRLVKRFMQERAKPFIDDPTWPAPRPNPDWHFRLPVRKAIAPGENELRINPRARSAKLRVAELLDPASSRP